MKEFEGKYEGIVPSKILDKDNQTELDNFFLMLGVIFNDLKGLLFFSNLLKNTYRPLSKEESVGQTTSAHLGEFSGLNLQISRLIIGLISEFILFLRENEKVLNHPRFKLFEKQLDKKMKKPWSEILTITFSKDTSSQDFLSKVARVRGNIVFHYSKSRKEIPASFLKKFNEEKKTSANQKAYYSIGSRMEDTRFYYCDAAVQEYLKEHLTIDPGQSHFSDIVAIVENMNQAIAGLLHQYISYKKQLK
ncbi:MAG: hypothetical protein AAB391_01185 [Patescibacteria group bacterium]